MNFTTETLYHALLDEDLFATEETEKLWSEMISDAKNNKSIDEKVGEFWRSTSKHAFQVGLNTAFQLMLNTAKTYRM